MNCELACSLFQGEQLRGLLQLQVLCAVPWLRIRLLSGHLGHCHPILHHVLEREFKTLSHF